MASSRSFYGKWSDSYHQRDDNGNWSSTRNFKDRDGNIISTSTISNSTAKGSLGSALGSGSKKTTTASGSSSGSTGSGSGSGSSGYNLDTSTMPTWSGNGTNLSDIARPNYTDLSTIQGPNITNLSDIAGPQYTAGTTPDLSVDNSKSQSWAQELEGLYNQIKNRGAFTYDQSSDPLYQQYAEMYANNAKLAMQDTVGQVSAMTGGYGNSYAETAGQSMYNQQMDQLNSKALELYNAAENTYNNETNRMLNNYSLANSQYSNALNAENTQYNRLLDAYNIQDAQRQEQNNYNMQMYAYALQNAQDANNNAWTKYGYDLQNAQAANDYAMQMYQNDVNNYWQQKNFDYGVFSDDRNNWWNTQNFNYNAYRDAVSDSQWNKSFEYQQQQDAASNELAYLKYLEDQRQFNANLGENQRQFNLNRYDNNSQYKSDLNYKYDAAGLNRDGSGYTDWYQQQLNNDRADNYMLNGFNTDGSRASWYNNEYNDELDYKYAAAGINRTTGDMSTAAKEQAGYEATIQKLKDEAAVQNGRNWRTEQFTNNGGNWGGHSGENANLGNKIYSQSEFNAKLESGVHPVVGNKSNNYNGKGAGYTDYWSYINDWMDSAGITNQDERDYLYWYYTQ